MDEAHTTHEAQTPQNAPGHERDATHLEILVRDAKNVDVRDEGEGLGQDALGRGCRAGGTPNTRRHVDGR